MVRLLAAAGDDGVGALRRRLGEQELERVDLAPDRLLDGGEVAAGQVGAPDRALEQSVAREQQLAGLVARGRVDLEAAAPRRVAGRVDDLGDAGAEIELLAVGEPMLDG